MAFTHSPKIVTDGLIFYLDTGNPKSYISGSTTWNSLIGVTSGSLLGGVTYDSGSMGSLIFDGTDDYVQTNVSASFTEMTLMGFIKRTGDQAQFDGIFFNRDTSITGLNFNTANTLGYHWNAAQNTYDFISNLTIPNNTWSMVGMTVTSSFARLYLNTSIATNTVSHASTIINDLKLARDEFSTRYMSGSISTVMLYNRALSPQEVLQNFNAIRGRYGI
jgi:hypothetical protein